MVGGGGGIRTHGTLSRTPVFKTGAFDHSATPPARGGLSSRPVRVILKANFAGGFFRRQRRVDFPCAG